MIISWMIDFECLLYFILDNLVICLMYGFMLLIFFMIESNWWYLLIVRMIPCDT